MPTSRLDLRSSSSTLFDICAEFRMPPYSAHTAGSFGLPEWFAPEALDGIYFRLLPMGQNEVTAEEAAMLGAVFDEEGEMPARHVVF
jgi:hypothetical protein